MLELALEVTVQATRSAWGPRSRTRHPPGLRHDPGEAAEPVEHGEAPQRTVRDEGDPVEPLRPRLDLARPRPDLTRPDLT